MIGAPCVVDVLGTKIANGCERAVQGADDIGDGDRGWVLVQPVPTLGAPLARHESGLTQVPKDPLEELRGNALGRRKLLAFGEVVRVESPRGC